jgi:hypothetical protein
MTFVVPLKLFFDQVENLDARYLVEFIRFKLFSLHLCDQY